MLIIYYRPFESTLKNIEELVTILNYQQTINVLCTVCSVVELDQIH